jgi:hypothetical protein
LEVRGSNSESRWLTRVLDRASIEKPLPLYMRSNRRRSNANCTEPFTWTQYQCHFSAIFCSRSRTVCDITGNRFHNSFDLLPVEYTFWNSTDECCQIDDVVGLIYIKVITSFCNIIGPLVVGTLVQRVKILDAARIASGNGRLGILGIWGVGPDSESTSST